MLRILAAIVLIEWCLPAPSSWTPGERRDFLVEVTPAKATFFTGDDIEITALSAAGMSIGPSYVFELVQADKVVFEHSSMVAAHGRAERDGRPFHTATLVIRVDPVQCHHD